MSVLNNDGKLQQLADDYGYANVMEMLEHSVLDSVAPCICKNPGCDYSEELEPDQDQGWCEFCQEPTLVSCLVLAHIM